MPILVAFELPKLWCASGPAPCVISYMWNAEVAQLVEQRFRKP